MSPAKKSPAGEKKKAAAPRKKAAPAGPRLPAPHRERELRMIRACRLEPVDCTPIWMMRQAGRSLPAYKRLRKKYGLVEITNEPELGAKVTLMPLKEMELDAAVLFADIMLPLAGLGVSFELVEDVGPVVENPIRTAAQIKRMSKVPAAESVPQVLETIRILRKELDGVVPLIGFSGAPFTLASYLIEGRPTRSFSATKAFMYSHPAAWHALMERLVDMIVDYLAEQVAAGAQILQLFDSWIGALSITDAEEYVLPHTTRIFDETVQLGVPRINFGTNTGGMLELMRAPEPEVVGLDWRVPLDVAWDRVGFDKAVQGNLDPAVLLGPKEFVVAQAREVLTRAEGRPGHIFNLGHGVLPESSLSNLKLLVDTVHSFRLD